MGWFNREKNWCEVQDLRPFGWKVYDRYRSERQARRATTSLTTVMHIDEVRRLNRKNTEELKVLVFSDAPEG